MDPRAVMFRNRLRKNLRRLLPWARQQRIEALRLYDHDIPEVRVVVDRYGDRVVVWEYARRANPEDREGASAAEIDPGPDQLTDQPTDPLTDQAPPSAAYTDDILAVIAELCEVSVDSMYVKLRQRQRGPCSTKSSTRPGRSSSFTKAAIDFSSTSRTTWTPDCFSITERRARWCSGWQRASAC